MSTLFKLLFKIDDLLIHWFSAKYYDLKNNEINFSIQIFKHLP